jgi:polar amino acid transport system substrate-binding protein
MKNARQRWTMVAALAVVGALLALSALTAGCGSSGGSATAVPSHSSEAPISEQQVVTLVGATCAALETDAAGTLAAIDAGQPPYVDAANPELYAFIYDTDVTLVATPDAGVRGQNMKGKPDVVGKLFRDEIVAGALAAGSGTEEYVYKEPGKDGLFLKSTHYQLVTGSDSKQYVACAGRYLGPYEGTPPASPSPSAAAVTQADVRAFVEKAVTYAGANGKDAALAAFTAPGGEFHQGEPYIYAYDFSGTVIAHGGDPSLVGKDLIGMTDPNGLPVIRNLVRLAKGGSGWLYFMWGNPLNDNRVEPKLGYVMKVDDNWFLGSGTYGPAAIKPPSKAQVRAFVGEAVEYARKHGKKKAIAEFMDTGGRFFRGELYVFAYNYAGKVLCLPAEPQKVGEDRWDLQDPDGVYFVREFVAAARGSEAGWVSYQYVNPAQSYQVQQKTSYVRRVDGTWLLGAGTYRPAD